MDFSECIIIKGKSKSKIFIVVVISPLILFFLRRLRRLSLNSSILDAYIGRFCLLLFLLIHLFEIVVFVIPSGLILHLHSSQLLCIFFVVQAHIFTQQNQKSEAFKIIRVLLVYGLVYLQCLLVVQDSALTTGNHESPLDLFGLDLACSFQVERSFFIHTLLNIIDSQPSVCIDVCRQKSVAFKIIMQSLLLIILLKIR